MRLLEIGRICDKCWVKIDNRLFILVMGNFVGRIFILVIFLGKIIKNVLCGEKFFFPKLINFQVNFLFKLVKLFIRVTYYEHLKQFERDRFSPVGMH